MAKKYLLITSIRDQKSDDLNDKTIKNIISIIKQLSEGLSDDIDIRVDNLGLKYMAPNSKKGLYVSFTFTSSSTDISKLNYLLNIEKDIFKKLLIKNDATSSNSFEFIKNNQELKEFFGAEISNRPKYHKK